MRTALLLSILTLAGCQPYIDAESHLSEQAIKGIALVRDSQEEQSAVVVQYHGLQRQLLDQAFDADVRERPADGLSADWIVEHRKAYAAALDLLARQRQSAEQADQVTRSNLAAISLSLEQLQTLLKTQSSLIDLLPTQTPSAP